MHQSSLLKDSITWCLYTSFSNNYWLVGVTVWMWVEDTTSAPSTDKLSPSHPLCTCVNVILAFIVHAANKCDRKWTLAELARSLPWAIHLQTHSAQKVFSTADHAWSCSIFQSCGWMFNRRKLKGLWVYMKFTFLWICSLSSPLDMNCLKTTVTHLVLGAADFFWVALAMLHKAGSDCASGRFLRW